MRALRPALTTVAVAVLVITIAGCTEDAPADPDASSRYEPPGWMAAQVQADDERAAYLEACLTDAGFVFTKLPQGGYTFPPETAEAAMKKAQECTEENPRNEQDEPLTPDQWRAIYRMALDTRTCLIERGYDISEPVSEEEFVDSLGRWSAYESVDVRGMSNEDWADLQRGCPEPSLTGLASMS